MLKRPARKNNELQAIQNVTVKRLTTITDSKITDYKKDCRKMSDKN